MSRRKPFRLPERIVTLFFEDGPYEGLEVDVSLTVPQAMFWQVAAMADGEDITTEQAREVALLYGGQIRGWNLEGPDGQAVPATAESFADRLDSQTQAFLIGRWLKAVREPPVPLSPGPKKRQPSARKSRRRPSPSSEPSGSTE